MGYNFSYILAFEHRVFTCFKLKGTKYMDKYFASNVFVNDELIELKRLEGEPDYPICYGSNMGI